MTDEVLVPAEVAVILRVSESTVRRCGASGGTSYRRGRVVDIGVLAFERICGVPRSAGLCRVTVSRA